MLCEGMRTISTRLSPKGLRLRTAVSAREVRRQLQPGLFLPQRGALRPRHRAVPVRGWLQRTEVRVWCPASPPRLRIPESSEEELLFSLFEYRPDNLAYFNDIWGGEKGHQDSLVRSVNT